jgi:uncharacterized protein
MAPLWRRHGNAMAKRRPPAKGGHQAKKPPARPRGRTGGTARRILPCVALGTVVFFAAAATRLWLLRPAEPPARQAVAVLPPPRPPAIVVQPAPPPAPAPAPAQPAPVSLPPPSATPAPPPEPAWLRYATPSPPADGRPRIAIVIDDCGLDRPRTARAIDLPAPVTLTFLPYADDLPHQTEAARAHGHEILVHVPMQPLNAHLDMGPNGLAVDLPRDEVLRRLRWDLARFDDYVGINNHMGSRFTADATAMSWVMGELKSRGLMFLDSRTIGDTVGEKMAEAEDVPTVGRDVFLDDDRTAAAVEARLKDTEAVARRRGTAIAIGHPHDATLAALDQWIGTLQQSGFVLVPLTEVVEARRHGE